MALKAFLLARHYPSSQLRPPLLSLNRPFSLPNAANAPRPHVTFGSRPLNISTPEAVATANDVSAPSASCPAYSSARHWLYLACHARRLWLPPLLVFPCLSLASSAPLGPLAPWLRDGLLWSGAVALQRLSIRGPIAAVRKDLHGRCCVITGATSGIGFQTALQLLQMGATCLLTHRPTTDAKEFRLRLKNQLRDALTDDVLSQRIHLIPLDLGNPRSVEQAAGVIRSLSPKGIDLLVNAAAIWKEESGCCSYGVEEHIGVNFLGPFHFTESLLPLLSLARSPKGGGRVVYVTCATHNGVHSPDVVVQRMMRRPGPQVSQLTARCYSASKLGNIYHMQYIHMKEQLKAASKKDYSPVEVCCVDPGWTDTLLYKKYIPSSESKSPKEVDLNRFSFLMRSFRLLWYRTSFEGSQIVLQGCLEDNIISGGFYAECRHLPSGLSYRAHDSTERDQVIHWAFQKTLVQYRNPTSNTLHSS